MAIFSCFVKTQPGSPRKVYLDFRVREKNLVETMDTHLYGLVQDEKQPMYPQADRDVQIVFLI
jgi:hypothetical protein